MAGADHLLTPQALAFLQKALGVERQELREVTTTSAGMTNRSFRFVCRDRAYILRVPGEGTDRLIDRRKEAASYAALAGDPITDEIVAFDPETGYKLTVYWDSTRNCDPANWQEVAECMALLRQFHSKRLRVDHEFDLFGEIEFYESLREGPSEYPDYQTVRERCFRLRPFIESLPRDHILIHVDAVPDNFLFVNRPEGDELHLIDWEYAGMQDPHLDVAMFAIYAGYGRRELDRLIDLYFEDACDGDTRLKIYCYVALSGLLWSNWCEYKKALGVEFGDYAATQYRYGAEYSRLVLETLGQRSKP